MVVGQNYCGFIDSATLGIRMVCPTAQLDWWSLSWRKKTENTKELFHSKQFYVLKGLSIRPCKSDNLHGIKRLHHLSICYGAQNIKNRPQMSW